MIVGSLFSGLGGLDVACEWQWGAHTAWQLDLTGERIRRRHWPDAIQVVGDVQAVDPAALLPVDVLCGGFPCQDLSVAGDMAGLDGARSGLYREVLRFARVLAPRFVVMENVPGLLSYMPRLCRDFRGLGYGLTWAICEAADAGYPHLRRRVFVLATRGGGDVGLVPVDQGRRWTGQDDMRPWTTITASEDRGRRVSLARRDDPDMLTEQVRPWATPAAGAPNEGEDPATWHARRARILAEKGILNGEPLGQQARCWPTVTVNDSKNCGAPSQHERNSDALNVAVQHSGKRLNPAWVEALMALPLGWTDTEGPRLTVDRNAPAVRGRYPEGWDRTQPWPGYAWEPSRTLPDGDPVPGRPARIRALGNAVVPQQAHLALSAMLAPRQGSLWGAR